jgi:hypothetical protein
VLADQLRQPGAAGVHDVEGDFHAGMVAGRL